MPVQTLTAGGRSAPLLFASEPRCWTRSANRSPARSPVPARFACQPGRCPRSPQDTSLAYRAGSGRCYLIGVARMFDSRYCFAPFDPTSGFRRRRAAPGRPVVHTLEMGVDHGVPRRLRPRRGQSRLLGPTSTAADSSSQPSRIAQSRAGTPRATYGTSFPGAHTAANRAVPDSSPGVRSTFGSLITLITRGIAGATVLRPRPGWS
jgi:hypothetical protein